MDLLCATQSYGHLPLPVCRHCAATKDFQTDIFRTDISRTDISRTDFPSAALYPVLCRHKRFPNGHLPYGHLPNGHLPYGLPWCRTMACAVPPQKISKRTSLVRTSSVRTPVPVPPRKNSYGRMPHYTVNSKRRSHLARTWMWGIDCSVYTTSPNIATISPSLPV